MTDEMDGLEWLDLAMFYGYEMVPREKKEGFQGPWHEREDRRATRWYKLERLMRTDEETKQQFRNFAAVVSAWFAALPRHVKDRHDPELLQAIDEFNIFRIKGMDAVQEINEFLTSTGAQPVVVEKEFGGIAFAVPSGPLNSMTTAGWFEFATTSDKPIYQCARCGIPFHPTRSDATYHNASCRSAARKERQEGES